MDASAFHLSRLTDRSQRRNYPAFGSVWFFALACLMTQAIGCTRSTDFPSRPITIICPWSAGGGTDRVARQMAAELEAELAVPVNVINATGGGGVTGHTRGAQARRRRIHAVDDHGRAEHVALAWADQFNPP